MQTRAISPWLLLLVLVALGCTPAAARITTVGSTIGPTAVGGETAASIDQAAATPTATVPVAVGADAAAVAAPPSRSPPITITGAPGWRRARATSYGVGDGLLRTPLACGGTLTPSALEVASATLPCGTAVDLRLGPRTVVARVRDRRPTVPGMTFLLAPAVCGALRDCSGDIPILWRRHAG
jgi:hypothetical protein